MKVALVPLLVGTMVMLAGCVSTKSSSDQTPIPTDRDFQSVLFLNDHAGHAASGFAHIRNGKLYVVTAKHFAGYLSKEDSIGVYWGGRWNICPVHLVGHGKGDTDITVFVLGSSTAQKIFDQTPLLSSNDSLRLGCDVWYMGFPLGYVTASSNRSYPYPMLKHGFLASRSDHPKQYFFDGVCNTGFSGGPVYARTTAGNLRLIGVVSYRVEETVDANNALNAGIFAAYSAEYADSLIDANPIGILLHE